VSIESSSREMNEEAACRGCGSIMVNKIKHRQPQVGIFWLVNGNLFIDGTPLSNSEDYGDFKMHPAAIWKSGNSSNGSAKLLLNRSTRNLLAVASCTTRRLGDSHCWPTGASSETRPSSAGSCRKRTFHARTRTREATATTDALPACTVGMTEAVGTGRFGHDER
jgi:hypothetical protein